MFKKLNVRCAKKWLVNFCFVQDDLLNKQLGQVESKHGVAGYRSTQEELEKVSEQMSSLNTLKGDTLEDMSSLVQRLTLRINEKKNELSPIIKELRPLRQKVQVKQTSIL